MHFEPKQQIAQRQRVVRRSVATCVAISQHRHQNLNGLAAQQLNGHAYIDWREQYGRTQSVLSETLLAPRLCLSVCPSPSVTWNEY